MERTNPYYLADGLGSTTQLTDASGGVTDTYTYDVFGALRSTTGSTTNPFDFAGQQTDHTANRGLQYLRARHYDPSLGRFLGRDPLPFAQRYAYAGDDPVNQSDPSGRCHDRQRFAHPESPAPVATATPFPSAPAMRPEKPLREERFDACSSPSTFPSTEPDSISSLAQAFLVTDVGKLVADCTYKAYLNSLLPRPNPRVWSVIASPGSFGIVQRIRCVGTALKLALPIPPDTAEAPER